MIILRQALLLLCLAVMASSAAGASATSGDAVQTLRDPELYYLDHSDVSPPLRAMSVVPPSDTHRKHEINPANVKPAGPLTPPPAGWVDPLEAASRRPAPEIAVTTGLNFDGVGKGLGSYSPSSAPPDTNGAAGTIQYVQWVNTAFAVFNKRTGALVYGPAAGNTLWQGFGGLCESNNNGDPIATYDKLANRWVMTQFAFNASSWYQCVAVSTTSDATGSYRRFAYNFTALNDYPKLGVWPDAYYITFNMFGSPSGGRTCALDRNNMLSASGTPGPIQCFQLSSYWSLLPADLDGTTSPPAGAPNYQLNFGTNSLRLWRFSVNWATPSATTLAGPTTLTVASFSTAGTIPQAGTTQQLDSLSDRLMYRLAYRNFGTHESLVVNHSVSTSSAASGVRWYEIRNPSATPTVYQQGTFSPDSTSRWMGSIAQDRQGDMAVGYSASSSSIYPAIRYTGRLVGDTAGTMQAENTLINGGGSQTTGLGRWGDYSAMAVDPTDDCTFWYTTEYLKSSGTFNWSTRIGSFRFPTCPYYAARLYPSSSTGSSCAPENVWFNYGACGTWKEYDVTPGTWIGLYAYGDGCGGCVLWHVNFAIQEKDIWGTWVTVETHNPEPDALGMVYTTSYRPGSSRIRVYSPSGFYLLVYAQGIDNGGFETGSWANGWVVSGAQPYPSITSDATYVAGRGRYSLGNVGSGTYSGSNTTLWGYGKDVPAYPISAGSRLYFDTYGAVYSQYSHHHVKVWWTDGSGTAEYDNYIDYSAGIAAGWSQQTFSFPSSAYGRSINKVEISFHKDHSTYLRYKPTIFLDNISLR